MTLLKCEKHEGQFDGYDVGTHVCIHINKAVENETKIEFNRVDLGFEGIIYLCSDCLKRYKKLPNEDELDEDELNEKEKEFADFYKSITLCCFSCFEEWKKSINKEKT